MMCQFGFCRWMGWSKNGGQALLLFLCVHWIKGGVGLFFIGLVVKGIFWKTGVVLFSLVWEKRCGKFMGSWFL